MPTYRQTRHNYGTRRNLWASLPQHHAAIARITVGAHVVYYATEAFGIHAVHYGTVWGVLLLLMLEAVTNR